jgi:hypothetical protein
MIFDLIKNKKKHLIEDLFRKWKCTGRGIVDTWHKRTKSSEVQNQFIHYSSTPPASCAAYVA